METIVKFWQRIHFNIFELFKFTQIYIFGMPVFLLLKNKYIQNSYQKRAVINPGKKIKNVLIDPANSTIIRQTDVSVCIILVLIFIIIANLLSPILNNLSFWTLYKILFFGSFFIPSVIINYYLLWHKNKYLNKFKEFEHESQTVKSKWAWLSFIFVIGIISLFILSFSISA